MRIPYWQTRDANVACDVTRESSFSEDTTAAAAAAAAVAVAAAAVEAVRYAVMRICVSVLVDADRELLMLRGGR